MTDEAALLAAILAHPDEDTPRLMFADWLDEHGQPERAEFIRIQCDPTADEVAEDRAAELEERNRVKWLVGLPQFPSTRWEFRRGFPEYLEVTAEVVLSRFESFVRVPSLRSLTVYELSNQTTRDFVSRRWGSTWVALELEEDPSLSHLNPYDSTPAIVAVARSPQFKQLQHLQLSMFDFTQEGVAALASSPHLQYLRRLRLADYADGPLFAPLRERFGDGLVIG